MITKIVLTFFVISIIAAPILAVIGAFLEDNYWGVGEVIGAILYDIGVVVIIIDIIIVLYGLFGETIKLIWE